MDRSCNVLNLKMNFLLSRQKSYILLQAIYFIINNIGFILLCFVSAEPNLNIPIDDDSFLLKFLRPCRFYPDRALKMLRKFYKFKVKHPKYSLQISPNSIRHVYDNEVFEFLPTRTAQGGRVLIINIGSEFFYWICLELARSICQTFSVNEIQDSSEKLVISVTDFVLFT